MFQPPPLERYKFAFDFNDVLALSETWAVKVNTLNAVDRLRLAFSIDETTPAAAGSCDFPFRFKLSWRARRQELATNCLYVLRQVAAANVVADLWAELGRCDTTHRPTIQTLAKIRNLCALVVANGDVPDALRPFAIYESHVYAAALLQFALATKVKKPSQEHAGDAFRTLVSVWRALDGARCGPWDAAKKRFKSHVIQAACMSYVDLATTYKHIPGTDRAGDAEDNSKIAALARDAWVVATPEQRALPELVALNGVYSHLGAGAPMTMAGAVQTGVAPEYVGAVLKLRAPNVETVAGPPFVLQ